MSAFLTRYRFIAFFVGILIFFGLLVGLKSLKFDNDYRSFIGEDNAYLTNTDWLSERLGDGSESAVLIYQPVEGNIFDTLSLLQFSETSESAEQLPYVTNATSFFDQEKLIQIEDAEGNIEYRAANILFGINVFSADGQATIEREVRSLSTILRRYVASDMSSGAVLLTLDFQRDELDRASQIDALLEAVNTLENRLQSVSPGDQLKLAGSSLFDHAASVTVRQDLRRIVPIAVVLIFLILIVIYRSIPFALITMLIIIIPVLASAGAIALMGLSFSNLAMAGLLLVGTLAVADVLHVSNSYFLNIAHGESRIESLTAMLRQNIEPILATTVTTIFGQLAIVLSPAEPIRTMAWIVIFGSILALALALLMLPLLLSTLKVPKTSSLTTISKFLEKVCRFSIQRATFVVVVSLFLTGFACFGLFRASVSDSMSSWFSEQTEFNQGLAILESNYLGGDAITISVEAPATDIVAVRLYPSPSDTVDTFVDLNTFLETEYDGLWFTIPSLAQAVSSLIKSPSNNSISFETEVLQEDERFAGLRRFSSETVARSGLMTPYSAGRADYAIWRFDAEDNSSFSVLENAKSIEQVFNSQAEPRDVRLSGIGLAIADLSVQNYWAVFWGSVFSFLTVAIVLTLIFRSLGLGALAIIPNGLPILLTFGCWAWVYGEMNLAAITVYAVVLGIIVDDTIHIINKYSRELSITPNDPISAVGKAIYKSGVGIGATTFIIGLGFALLGTSDFLLTAHRSQMAAFAVFSAFIFDITLLPVLLVSYSKFLNARRSEGS